MWIEPRATAGRSSLWIALEANDFFELLESKAAPSRAGWFVSSAVSYSRNLLASTQTILNGGRLIVGGNANLDDPNTSSSSTSPSASSLSPNPLTALSAMEQPFNYRIVLLDEKSTAVAVADTAEEIRADWNWISTQLLPKLSKNPEDRHDMIKYLIDRFAVQAAVGPSSSRDPTDENVNQTAVSSSQASMETAAESFKELFPDIKDKLFTYYSCSYYWKGVYRPGWLYITEKQLCFASSWMDERIQLSFLEVTAIQKNDSSLSPLRVSIVITTKKEEYYLSLFFNPSEVCTLLEQLWQRQANRLLNISKQHLVGRSPSSTGDNAEEKSSSKEEEHHDKELETTQKALETETNNSHYQRKFRLPSTEALIAHYNCAIWWQEESRYVVGSLAVSTNFLCFTSAKKEKKFKFTIPISTIRGAEKGVPCSGAATLVVSLWNYEDSESKQIPTREIVLSFVSLGQQQYVNALKFVLKLWKATLLEINAQRMLPCQQYPFVSIFSQLELTTSANEESDWISYFQEHGFGPAMIKRKQLDSLVRSGIPHRFRVSLWQVFSGAIYKSYTHKSGHYQELLSNAQKQHTVAIDEIDKDVRRSLPEHPFFQDEQGVNSLRNILISYSIRNPIIGYCQAMNIVAAVMLLVMEEEAAFWTLCNICEELAPDYYDQEMLGSMVDKEIFEELVASYLPEVTSHLQSFKIPVSLISLPWLLCFFIGTVPLQDSLRILDCFFYFGRSFLLQLGLAMLSFRKPQILESSDSDSLIAVMKAEFLSGVDELFQLAFDSYGNLPRAKIRELRNTHKYEMILDISKDRRI